MFRVCADPSRTRADGNETVVASDNFGGLADLSGNIYTGTFDGKNVRFAAAGGSTFVGCWIQGSGETTGIVGGGKLSGRFSFTFFDYGDGSQRLNAGWTFRGSSAEAVVAWEKAGYAVSWLDSRFNREHEVSGGESLIHMRGRGSFLTGADSGHAILVVDAGSSSYARGQVHVGEHNPTAPFGFVLHHAERMTAQRRSLVLGYGSILLSLFCWVNVYARGSIFNLFSSTSARRGVVIVGAFVSVGLAVLAGRTGSKWWWLAAVPAIALYGLVALH